MAQRERNFADLLMAVPKQWLYVLLILATTIPLWFTVAVPNRPVDSSVDLYQVLNDIPEGSTILIASDWTNSTRGESGGQFKSLMRILMRRNVKFAVYSTADPQAPRVAEDFIERINQERRAADQPPYQRWQDWVGVGYFPNAEGTANAIANNIRSAWAGKTDFAPDGVKRDVFQSPVLQQISRVEDFPLLIVVTASKTSNVTIERLYGRVPLALMVTGVMGPEMQVYHASGQVRGLSAGLKGVYDVELMMERDYPGQKNLDNGGAYYPALHAALTLLILAVVVGNIGMFMNRRRRGG
jgi:hypothetical protein